MGVVRMDATKEKIARETIQRLTQRGALYLQGYTDQEIALIQGVTKQTVRDWRVQSHKLPPNRDARRVAYH